MSNPFPQPGVPDAVASAWIANASNVKTTTNPPYTEAMFLEDFSQFTGLVPPPIVTQFISMATNTVLYARWHDGWRYGMGLFIAHYSTLFIQAAGIGADSTAGQVVTNAQGTGLATSQSVGDVSVSYDYGAIMSGLEGWADWTSTSYGRQYATMARMLGKAGMYVW